MKSVEQALLGGVHLGELGARAGSTLASAGGGVDQRRLVNL